MQVVLDRTIHVCSGRKSLSRTRILQKFGGRRTAGGGEGDRATVVDEACHQYTEEKTMQVCEWIFFMEDPGLA